MIKSSTKTSETIQEYPVISASRATDIPAFYAKWFINRLRAGSCLWVNPFNRNQRKVISFESCKAIVFWSKNPAPLIDYLNIIDEKNIGYYFQFTLNDYEKEKLEPNVPPIEKRIETFIRLSNMIGKERVIWRFDPILKTDALHQDEVLKRIQRIGEKLCEYTEKLVFSFIDMSPYKSVQKNLKKYGPSGVAELSIAERGEFAKSLAGINSKWKHSLTLATCAEDIPLDELKIEHNSCIDANLICKICHNDPSLLKHFGFKHVVQPSLLQYSQIDGNLGNNNTQIRNLTAGKLTKKDSGQRKDCRCAKSKDIGAYETCMHLCTYCYANHAQERVKNNYKKCTQDCESLMPVS